jgi:hypothetical protein
MEDGTTVCYPQYSQNPVVDAAACYRHWCRNNIIGSNILNIRRGESGRGHRMDLNPKTVPTDLDGERVTLVTLPLVITSRPISGPKTSLACPRRLIDSLSIDHRLQYARLENLSRSHGREIAIKNNKVG